MDNENTFSILNSKKYHSFFFFFYVTIPTPAQIGRTKTTHGIQSDPFIIRISTMEDGPKLPLGSRISHLTDHYPFESFTREAKDPSRGLVHVSCSDKLIQGQRE